MTKEQKLEALTLMMFYTLSNIESCSNDDIRGLPSGLCSILDEYKDSEDLPRLTEMSLSFPIIYQLREEGSYFRGYWWTRDLNGYQKRLDAIEKQIVSLENSSGHRERLVALESLIDNLQNDQL